MDLPKISDPSMDAVFTQTELDNVIKELPSEKAPGLDGFTGSFYKQCWTIIRDDVLAAMVCFHELRTGPLEKLNSANIVLIPKIDVPEHIKDFRPISLIHSFGKLITKTLALRLSRHISSLVSHSQSAFIKRRCIQDNYMYVRNLARAYHRTKTPALLFKLDISKALDTVSWEYILGLLEHRGFSPRWREWLSTLFRTSQSAVLLNGGKATLYLPTSSSLPLTHFRGYWNWQPWMAQYHLCAGDKLGSESRYMLMTRSSSLTL